MSYSAPLRGSEVCPPTLSSPHHRKDLLRPEWDYVSSRLDAGTRFLPSSPTLSRDNLAAWGWAGPLRHTKRVSASHRHGPLPAADGSVLRAPSRGSSLVVAVHVVCGDNWEVASGLQGAAKERAFGKNEQLSLLVAPFLHRREALHACELGIGGEVASEDPIVTFCVLGSPVGRWQATHNHHVRLI